jgi:pentatricopeptide repeat protein
LPKRSVVSWTTTMNGYQKLGCPYEVVRLLMDMLTAGVQGKT